MNNWATRRNEMGGESRGCDDDSAGSAHRRGSRWKIAPAMIQIAARALGSSGTACPVPVSQPHGALVLIAPVSPFWRGALWPVGTILHSTCSQSPAREFRNDLTASLQRFYGHAPGVFRQDLPRMMQEQEGTAQQVGGQKKGAKKGTAAQIAKICYTDIKSGGPFTFRPYDGSAGLG